jgi:transcriptional regulator with XRE-family HTH domain
MLSHPAIMHLQICINAFILAIMTDQNPALHIEEMASQAGVSMNELCALADVARTTLTRWKNGTTSPNMATLKKLEDTLALIVKKANKLKSVNKHKESKGPRQAPNAI